MLLGSPPDMVHRFPSRETDLSTPLIWVRQHTKQPRAGIHPRYSGLRIQGTANSPTSAALPSAERTVAGLCHKVYFTTDQVKKQEPSERMAPSSPKAMY